MRDDNLDFLILLQKRKWKQISCKFPKAAVAHNNNHNNNNCLMGTEGADGDFLLTGKQRGLDQAFTKRIKDTDTISWASMMQSYPSEMKIRIFISARAFIFNMPGNGYRNNTFRRQGKHIIKSGLYHSFRKDIQRTAHSVIWMSRALWAVLLLIWFTSMASIHEDMQTWRLILFLPWFVVGLFGTKWLCRDHLYAALILTVKKYAPEMKSAGVEVGCCPSTYDGIFLLPRIDDMHCGPYVYLRRIPFSFDEDDTQADGDAADPRRDGFPPIFTEHSTEPGDIQIGEIYEPGMMIPEDVFRLIEETHLEASEIQLQKSLESFLLFACSIALIPLHLLIYLGWPKTPFLLIILTLLPGMLYFGISYNLRQKVRARYTEFALQVNKKLEGRSLLLRFEDSKLPLRDDAFLRRLRYQLYHKDE